jgi:hypothetical protein
MGVPREAPADGGSDTAPTLHPFLVTSAFGLPVCRLGLASYGQTALTADDVHAPLGRGVNFLNWAGLFGHLLGQGGRTMNP